MISRRTWVLFAATAIAFAISLLYWEQRPKPSETGAAFWDISQFGAMPDEEWAGVGELCAAALSISLLVDFVAKRRRGL